MRIPPAQASTASRLHWTRAPCPHCNEVRWLEPGAPVDGTWCRPCTKDPGRVAQCECCYTTCKAAPLHPKHERHDACTGKFCGACAAHFYRGQLEDGMWNLRCPSVGCTAAPHDGTMAMLPGGELLATWRAQLRSAARNVHLQELLAESPELASWAKGGNAQACPSCFSLVQRTEGCPHMTCKCGAQFCYTCGAPWPCGQSHADTLPRLAEPEAVVPEAVAVPVAA